MSSILTNTQILWDYMRMQMPLEKADCIFVLGSNDLRVASYAAQLYLEGWGDYIIFSGGYGNFTKGIFQHTESELFTEVTRNSGIPIHKIIVESKATNTGENVTFTLALLASLNLSPKKWLLVQKPFMERRTYATFKKHLPDSNATVTSPPISFLDYPNSQIPLEDLIHIIVGDTQPMLVYPKKSFIIEQPMPPSVHLALEELLAAGYTHHALK